MLQPADQQIFLIDEDEIVRDSLKVLLESHGMQVRDYRSAAEFLAKTDTLQGGCVVLGHNRGIVDGLELMVTLRRRGATMPVIFVVGGGNAMTKATAIAAGAFAYLERPIEEAALIRTIRAAMTGKSTCKALLGQDQPAASAPVRG